ncbi:YjbQ family protein [Altererythrobacter salegens]|uniref:YjbQ family protein n=1 Tax=Croceibacterium salegens TaxID=1737568 RepID=A0A6I4T0U6_9SPHN|nr:secondary thiamine-phosphate synthase enzyme YjbQ [Croceibacterium salegens]MXO60886.1 YjbQ family protein [Croceibacterium salegens]
MRQAHAILTFQTDGQGLLDVTPDIHSWLRACDIQMGTVTLFCQHTSASLLINENAAPAVRRDILRWLDMAAPEGDYYEHDSEGSDDMPAHIKSMLTGNSLTVPFADGKMLLGTWQGVYLAEHRADAHRRYVVCHAMGD